MLSRYKKFLTKKEIKKVSLKVYQKFVVELESLSANFKVRIKKFLSEKFKTVYISEPGLYQLIISSRLEAADRFRCQVFEEVLPSIRKSSAGDCKKQLAWKDEQLALNDKEYVEQLFIKDAAIEEKDTTLTLMNDDLEDCDNQIQATQYENVGIQGEIRAKGQQIYLFCKGATWATLQMKIRIME